jgi:RNA polymerase sigma factor for flagellar operon FliA
LVLSLYYLEDLNLKEIGKVMGLTESRISQIRSSAVLRLRSKLAEMAKKDKVDVQEIL